MFSFLKKLFRKPTPKAATPRVVTARARPTVGDPNQSRPQVEVAHLSLAAILGKFPDDLKRNVVAMPEASVTVALPLATIHKQLPSGSVKMSLASLYRQAPRGVFAPNARLEEKRMVEVPLPEIFRHVRPQGLRRRDQKQVELPGDAPELFSDRENPYALAPGVPDAIDEPQASASMAVGRATTPQPQRMVKPPAGFGARNGDSNATPMVAVPPAGTSAAPRTGGKTPSHSQKTAAAASNEPPLLLPLSQLCEQWPEPIRGEALELGDTMAALPAAQITAGLAKGKIVFTWGQIRTWLNPPPPSPTQAKEATELILPLKVVAPAFLAARPVAARQTVQLDDSIPALFTGGTVAKAAVPLPIPALATPAPAAPPAAAAPTSLPAPPGMAGAMPVDNAPAPAATSPGPTTAPGATPAVARSLGELLKQPEKENWSPQELINATISQPGVSGAAIGLDEGLLVAAHLPPEFKGDTVAAFLPQMFARLNNYSGEMKLGEINELLLTTSDAHFQAYRIKDLYYAVLGKANESLPWDSLRLVVDQLARQNSK